VSPRSLRLLALLACSATAAVALPACGGEDSAQDLLSETFGADKPIRSGKLAVRANLNLTGVEGLAGPIALQVSGPFQSAGKGQLPNFDLSANLTAGGETLQIGAVSTGDKGYVKLQGLAFDIGDQLYASFKKGYQDAQKQAGTETKDAPTFEALGIKPLRWLSSPERIGEEDVGGSETVKIAAKVDVKTFLADISRLLDRAEGLQIEGAGDVPGGLSAKQQAQVVRSVKRADVEVWTGKDDKTLRRLRIVIDLAVPADARKGLAGLEKGKIDFAVSINDLNGKQRIQAPADARPLSELTGAAGEQGEGGGQPAAPEQPAAPQAPTAPPRYLECLESAGDDIAKLQGCAELL
jgi:hypothetical protein